MRTVSQTLSWVLCVILMQMFTQLYGAEGSCAGNDSQFCVHALSEACAVEGQVVDCYLAYSSQRNGIQAKDRCDVTSLKGSADAKHHLEDPVYRISYNETLDGVVFDHMVIRLNCDDEETKFDIRSKTYISDKKWSISHNAIPYQAHFNARTENIRHKRDGAHLSGSASSSHYPESHNISSMIISTAPLPGYSISSPHYPYDYSESQNVSWTLTPLPGYRIVAQIEFLNISKCSHNHSCCDVLTITDTNNSLSSPLELCGSLTALEPLHPTGELHVNFVSDEIHVPGANGFRLSYYQERVKYTDVEGVIRSPSYGGDKTSLYPNSLHLQWYIQVPEDHHILIWFSEPFHLEGVPGSCHDKLTRGSGLEVGLFTYLPELCGSHAPDMYYTLGNEAWFSMDTDTTLRYEGFELNYRAEKRIFTEPTGVLTSPLYPEKYPTPIYTQYIIQAPDGYIVMMHIEMFDVADCVRDEHGLCKSCSNDNYLEVETLPGPLSSYTYEQSGVYLSKRYCNGLPPNDKLMSVDNGVQITFKTTGGEPGYGFKITYEFVSNRAHIRPMIFTQVKFAPFDTETLGLIFYEIVVPKGHNLEAWNPHIKLRCGDQEAMIFAHELEDMLYGNSQLVCTEDGENIDEDLLFVWLQPQYKLGLTEWVMRIIISTQYTDSSLQLTFWADNPMVTTSLGYLYTLGIGNVWASYRDVDKGLPTNVVTARAPTCQSIEYRVALAPSCQSEAIALLRSPYLIPYGLDQEICGEYDENDWRHLDGNELTLIHTQDPYHDYNEDDVVVIFRANERDIDCSFELNMCNWTQVNTTIAPVRWERTSEEILARFVDSYRTKHIAPMLKEFWAELNEPITDYYMHVHMDRSYPGEKAQLISPLMSAYIRRSLSFRYHMYGVNVGHLNVYTWTPSSNTWRLVWSRYGDTGLITMIDVEGIPVSACSDYHVVFEATIPKGFMSEGAGDIAVDSIFFCDVPDGAKDCDDDVCGNGHCIDVVPSTLNNGASQDCCCDDGFTGHSCDTKKDLCADGLFTCQHGGTCRTWQYNSDSDKIEPAVCDCAPGWSGDHCQTEIDECASHPCQHDARCIDGLAEYHCICPMYYTGIHCEINQNICDILKPCKHEGECVNIHMTDYRCICPEGFTGYTCEQEVNECARRPCLNNGICMDLLNDFQCSCRPGYSGKQCEININSCAEALNLGLCYNGASCLDTINGFKCQCAEGWQGAHCDTQVDECLTDPCVNNARCVDRFRDYQCLCEVGYEGKRCEREIDYCIDNRCEQGICEQDRTGYKCNCLAGFTGEFCEVMQNACKDQPCDSGATCNPLPGATFYCVCPPGRTGTTCSEDVDYCKDSQACLNGGACVSLQTGFRCDCSPGFFGHLCEHETSGCQGRQCIYGICVDKGVNGFTCNCEEGWSGVHCDVATYNTACQTRQPCDDGSTCVDIFNDYLCLCPAGRTGSHCDIDISECASNPCMNRAQCVEGDNSYMCNCRPGYRGVHCEEKIDPCEDLHCYNGDCEERNGQATCQCYNGYEGEECQQVVDNCATSPCHPSAACHNLIDDYYCECNPALPLTGHLCSEPVDVCASQPCRNGVRCVNEGFAYRCVCPANTAGEDCSRVIRPCDNNPCKHGSCINVDTQRYECRCESGWEGSTCDSLADRCSELICSNGGSCYINSEGQPFCVCPRTYSGVRCQQPVDPCYGRVCHNGGHCVVGTVGLLTGIAYCDCAQGFDGYSCEVELASGALVGGLRMKRDMTANGSSIHDINRRAIESADSTEPTAASPAEVCHYLGNDTTSMMRWIIVCITVGLYLIVLLSAVSYTIISLRLVHSDAKGKRYRNSSGSNNNSLRYYTPQKTLHVEGSRRNAPARGAPHQPAQPAYFSPTRRSVKSLDGNAPPPQPGT